jgi:5'-3' exonuclease
MGDVLVYRMGFALENEEEDYVGPWVGGYLNEIAANLLQVAEWSRDFDTQIFLSPTGKENFRYSIYDQYKANRVQPKPKYYDLIRSYLIAVEEAVVTQGQEADDAIGIASAEQAHKGIIVTVDKDLRQIPTTLFNPVKKTLETVSVEEGIRWFYIQLLTGDISDNIPGIPGIGPVKAERIVSTALITSLEDTLYWLVLREYLFAFQNLTTSEVQDMVIRNGKLLKIRQSEEEIWEPPYPYDYEELEKIKQDIIQERKNNGKSKHVRSDAKSSLSQP